MNRFFIGLGLITLLGCSSISPQERVSPVRRTIPEIIQEYKTKYGCIGVGLLERGRPEEEVEIEARRAYSVSCKEPGKSTSVRGLSVRIIIDSRTKDAVGIAYRP